MSDWVKGFASWDVYDQVCGGAFLVSPLAWHKVSEWADGVEEFVRRAAFALLAMLTVYDKLASDARFTAMLSLIEVAAGDKRKRVALTYAQHKGLPTSCFGETDYFVVGVKEITQ